MYDTILVRNLRFHGMHGVYEEERIEGRRFEVDLTARALTARAGATDELQETVDYRDLATCAVEVMTGRSHYLIEALAEEIAALVLQRCVPVSEIEVAVRKWATGVPGDPEWVGVTIVRAR
jgi:dihydroneopterin aldolase